MAETLPKTEPIVEIVEGIAASLNEAQFSFAFTTEVQYTTDWQRDDEQLHVVVMPVPESSETSELIARDGTTQTTYRVQVGVQRECKADDTESLAQLLALVLEIKDHLKVTSVAERTTWLGHEHEEIYEQDSLKLQGLFRTAPTFIYRGGRRI